MSSLVESNLCSPWMTPDGQRLNCPNEGHPDLDGLCPEHFLERKVRPAADRAFEAGQEHVRLLIKLNKVEVALGLRPAPYERDEAQASNKAPAKRASVVGLSRQSSKVTVVTSDVVEDELDGLE